jgi:hypothetical protein
MFITFLLCREVLGGVALVLLAFALGDLSQVAGVKGVDTAGQFDAVVADDLTLRGG